MSTDDQDGRTPDPRASTNGKAPHAPSPKPPRAPTALDRFKAQAEWVSIRKHLVLYAFKLNHKSLEGVEDFVQTGIATFVAEHGHDIQALGGKSAVLPLLKIRVANARDRRRQTSDRKHAGTPLTPALLGALRDESMNPERALMENHRRRTWDQFIDRVTELAEPYPCGKVLMEGFNTGEGASLARAAGFTQADINNERQRLKRLGHQAARELGLEEVPTPVHDTEGATP